MVLLSLGAQLIETVVVRGMIYTVELGGRVVWWLGRGALEYIWPPDVEESEVEELAMRIRALQERVNQLEEERTEGQREEYVYKDYKDGTNAT